MLEVRLKGLLREIALSISSGCIAGTFDLYLSCLVASLRLILGFKIKTRAANLPKSIIRDFKIVLCLKIVHSKKAKM